jgi:GNAT superfamily N-acetyltransferase
MDGAAVLALMDLNMQEMYREDARTTAGGFIAERDGMMLCGSPHGSKFTNMLVVVGRGRASAIRSALDETFRSAGLPCSVWTRTHADGALENELRREGFEDLLTVPAMMLSNEVPDPSAPPELDLRPVADDAGRRDYLDVMVPAWGVYGIDAESTACHFPTVESLVGPMKTAFVAYRDGVPVAGAILYLSHEVAGIGWVGTVPEACGRGYGAAVTWAVVREGRRRGTRFSNLQASPLGASVYRRMGFTTPTEYRVFVLRG